LARLAFSDESLFALLCHNASILSVMSHPLDGCWLKVERANVHLGFLHQRVQSFLDNDPYPYRAYRDPETGEIILYAEPVQEPPMLEWSGIIGDIVHNLRSALDHLLWQLTLANGHTPPAVIPRKRNAPGGKWRDISFPIHLAPYPVDHLGNLIPWVRAKEPKSLWGIGPSLRADLQRLQPFNHGQDAPKKPLAVLDELWNTDKHRHLALTGFFVELRGVVHLFISEPEIMLRVLEKSPPSA